MNDYFYEMFEYNKYANNLFIDTILKLNIENTKINKLFSHILNAHDIWIYRLQRRLPRFKLWDIHQNKRLSDINQTLYIESLYFINILGDSQYQEIVKYKNSKGETNECKVIDGLTQLINHSTHHRAQLSLLMRQLDIEPPISDYIYYIRDKKNI